MSDLDINELLAGMQASGLRTIVITDEETPMKDEALIDAVIEQILIDIQSKDMTAIVELLRHVPEQYLVGYLGD
jgi:DNA-binding MurR/RpiR family transcriptional regulator